MSEELQDIIDRRFLWEGYEISTNEQAKNIIRNNINRMCDSWVSTGFVLKQARDKEFYREDGYDSIQDYAYGEFGIKKQRASRLIKIIEKLSVNGNAPVLDDRWKEFSIAKLEEIIYLDNDQLEQVTVGTTVAQIREIKNPERVSISKLETEPEIYATSHKESKPEPPKPSQWPKVCKYDGKSNCVACRAACCSECDSHGSCNTECGWQDERMPKQDSIPMKVNNRPETVDYQPEIVNDVDEPVDNEPDIVDGSDLPCDTCGNDVNGSCDYPDTPEDYCVEGDKWVPKEADQVETIEADIIQTVPDDPEHYTIQDVKEERDKLTEYVNVFRRNNDTVPGRRKAKMRLDAIELLAMEIQRPAVIEKPEPIQPELPILKNNDQRKDFIDTYATWPIWIDLKETGERYYRYDLTDKVAMVVKVNQMHHWQSKDIVYGAEQYYLLGIKPNYSAKVTFPEDDTRTFHECWSSKSVLIDYLKAFQKK